MSGIRVISKSGKAHSRIVQSYAKVPICLLDTPNHQNDCQATFYAAGMTKVICLAPRWIMEPYRLCLPASMQKEENVIMPRASSDNPVEEFRVVLSPRDFLMLAAERRFPEPTARPAASELPILVNRFDGPVKLLPQRFGKELLDRHVELLRKNNSKTGINVVLQGFSQKILTTIADDLQSSMCPKRLPCCSLCPLLETTWP